jgi:hypothetical protein
MGEDEGKKRAGLGLIVAGGLLLLLGGWVLLTVFESEEDKVRRVFVEIAEAAADRNPRDISDHLAQDFRCEYQRYAVSKEDVHRALLQVLLTQYKHGFRLTYDPALLPVEMAEDEQSARVRFKLNAEGQASPDGGWIKLRDPIASGKVWLDATLNKTDEGWQISRVSFELVGAPAAEGE